MHEVETNTDKRVDKVENRLSLVQGVLVALVLAIGTGLVKNWIERSPEKTPAHSQQQLQPPAPAPMPKAQD